MVAPLMLASTLNLGTGTGRCLSEQSCQHPFAQGRRDFEPRALGRKQLVRRQRAFHQPGWRVAFGREQVVAQLVRERSAQGAAKIGFAKGTLTRSEEHTSELQSHLNLVCRLLLEK